ncbi:MAG TPA: hypothetical protein DCQ49_11580, partial [Methylophaga sp.]|nr:hypothetical protein [Methylophaga sp.]
VHGVDWPGEGGSPVADPLYTKYSFPKMFNPALKESLYKTPVNGTDQAVSYIQDLSTKVGFHEVEASYGQTEQDYLDSLWQKMNETLIAAGFQQLFDPGKPICTDATMLEVMQLLDAEAYLLIENDEQGNPINQDMWDNWITEDDDCINVFPKIQENTYAYALIRLEPDQDDTDSFKGGNPAISDLEVGDKEADAFRTLLHGGTIKLISNTVENDGFTNGDVNGETITYIFDNGGVGEETMVFDSSNHDQTNNGTIRLISTDNTSVTYKIKNDGSANAGVQEFNAGATRKETAENFASIVMGVYGHAGKIKVLDSNGNTWYGGGDFSNGTVVIQQAVYGAAGNTSITTGGGFDNTTSTNASAFTGGGGSATGNT